VGSLSRTSSGSWINSPGWQAAWRIIRGYRETRSRRKCWADKWLLLCTWLSGPGIVRHSTQTPGELAKNSVYSRLTSCAARSSGKRGVANNSGRLNYRKRTVATTAYAAVPALD